MNIAICGSGIVGIATGEGLSKVGHNIYYYDVIDKQLENFSKDLQYVIDRTKCCIICVPTPTNDIGEQNLDIIKNTSKGIGKCLSSKKEYYLVVVKSTVLPKTTREQIIPILEQYSKKKCGKEFGVCMNPEFLTEAASSWTDDKFFHRDFNTEEKIIIGEYDNKSGDILESIYEPLFKRVFRVNLETAEMIKYATNCICATRISFWNEIFLICEELDVAIDSKEVADIVCLDPRIGKYGSTHGLAYGGKCLDKDSKAFINWASPYRTPTLIDSVSKINDIMKKEYGVRE